MGAGGDPDQLWGALPRDVTARGVPLDDAEDQTHGRAVGQRHPLAGRQAEPGQASEEEGGPDIHTALQRERGSFLLPDGDRINQNIVTDYDLNQPTGALKATGTLK